MPVSSPAPATRKKESWLGVLCTAALCGIFLWWWFQPAPASAESERNPHHWIGRARKDLGRAEPTLGMRMDVIMIAEAWRGHGELAAADSLEVEWLPPSWRVAASPATAPNPNEATDAPSDDREAVITAPGPPVEFAPVGAQLDEAAAAFDSLEIERGQNILRDASAAAAAMPATLRANALWLVAARQARSGLGADAAATREILRSHATNQEFPDWLVEELLEAEIIAPVVDALGALPPDAPAVVAVARRWRGLVHQRFTSRESPWFTRLGPAADASRPDTASAHPLWASVEANQLGAAGGLAKNDPAAQLAIARLLVWLAAPAP